MSTVLAACSAYQSSGRKTFEDKAPDRIQRSAIAGLAKEAKEARENVDQFERCWDQPSSEPLWHVDSKSALTVIKLDDDQLRVCFPEVQ